MKFHIAFLSSFILSTLFFSSFSMAADETEKWPIGVIARFDDHGTGLTLDRALSSGVSVMQLKVPVKENRTNENVEKILELTKKHGVTITCVISGFSGESYASIPIVKETVGLVPGKTRKERIEDFKDVSDFAKKLGVPSVQFHLGFVPHDTQSQDYKEIVRVTAEICDYIAQNDQWLNLETGQETGPALLRFIQDVDRKNLFVNFDPANMILYGCGEPNEALELVGKYVRSTHCKDAKWAKNLGEEWGTEVVFGEGDVDAERFLQTLKKIGYNGPLIIERENKESPEAQYNDVLKTIGTLKQLKKNILHETTMQTLDWIVMIGFFLAMIGLGWWSRIFIKNTNDFFTGGGKMPWWLIGISHHVSGYSAVAFTAYAGIAYKYGFSIYVWWAFPIAMACYLGVWVFAPRWSRLRTHFHIESPLEFISTRYNVPTQQLLAWWGVLLKIIDVGAKWAALAIILTTFTSMNFMMAIWISVAVGLFYSTIGGLWAGTLTDFVQFIVQFAAGIIMFAVAISRLGGIESIWTLWNQLPPEHSQLLVDKWDVTFLIAILLINILGYNGGTWNLAQRYIAAPTGKDAKKAAILSATLYLLWPLVLFFPMWAAPILLPGIPENKLEASFCIMVMDFLPTGLVGLMLASLVSHTLSMTTADATAITSVLSRDIVPKIWKQAASFNDKQALFTARVITFVFMVCTGVIAMFSSHFGGIIGLILSWFSALLGPVSVPMILGLLPAFRRCGSVSAFAAVIAGLIAFVVCKYDLFITTSFGVNLLAPTLTALVVYCLFGLINIVRNVPTKQESDAMLEAISLDRS